MTFYFCKRYKTSDARAPCSESLFFSFFLFFSFSFMGDTGGEVIEFVHCSAPERGKKSARDLIKIEHNYKTKSPSNVTRGLQC